jgi:hypothetical protein
VGSICQILPRPPAPPLPPRSSSSGGGGHSHTSSSTWVARSSRTRRCGARSLAGRARDRAGADLAAWPAEFAIGPARSSRPRRRGALAAWPARSSRPGRRSSRPGRRRARGLAGGVRDLAGAKLAAWPSELAIGPTRISRFCLAQDRPTLTCCWKVEADMWGPHVSESRRFFFSNTVIHVHIRYVVWAPTSLRRPNCNDKFQNRRIVMTFLQL